MPLILVVENDAGLRDRISEALRRDGHSVETATSRAEALARAERSAPGLLVASSATPEARELLADFSRHRGGPGAVVLIDDPDDSSAEEYPADEVLAAPFEDDQLRQLVQRLLSSAPSRQSGPMGNADSEQLTSEDIFGDVLAEVEAGTAGTARKPSRPMADIERRLEETLSGVIPTSGKERRPAQRRKAGKRRGEPRKRRPEQPGTEIDDLLTQTLSSLDIPTRPRRPATGAVPEAPAGSDAGVATPAESAEAEPSSAEPTPAEPTPAEAGPPEPDPTEPSPAEDPGDAAGEPRPIEPTPEPVWAAPPVASQPPPGEAPSAVEKPAAGEPAAGEPAASTPAEPAPADDFRTQRLQISLPQADVEAGAPEADALDAAGGEAFGEYTLLDRIAVGGMAEVWRARRRGVEGFQKTVAIKKILSNLTGSKDFVTMFIDEAKLAAQLSHNNIIQIYDLGKVGDDFFIAMEHVDGKDLRSILTAAQEAKRPLPLGLALLIVGAVASALDYAHRKRDFDGDAMGLVHRDVSPQNVMISYEGSIKLCDFGIVKAVAKASTTQMGALKGKLQYMSPEQAWGKSVDARSDIFSLGSVFYEVLTGRQLFSGDSEIGVLDSVRECRIRSPREIEPSVPEEVARIAAKALAKSPGERYQTAGDMEHEIRKVLDDLRPTPSQKDLAIYMRTLFETSLSGPVAVSAAAAGAPAASDQAAPAAGDRAASVAAEAAGSAVKQPEPVAAPAAGAPGAGTPAAGAPAAGRWKWLAAAIAAVALAGVGLLVLPSLTRRETPPPSPPVATPAADPEAAAETPPNEGLEAAAETPPSEGPAPLTGPAAAQDESTGEPGTGETTTAETPPPGVGEEPDEADTAVTAAGVDIEQLVNQELSTRADQLRLELEAKKRKLEQELAQAQAENESARAKESEDTGGDGESDDGSGGGGGDGR